MLHAGARIISPMRMAVDMIILTVQPRTCVQVRWSCSCYRAGFIDLLEDYGCGTSAWSELGGEYYSTFIYVNNKNSYLYESKLYYIYEI